MSKLTQKLLSRIKDDKKLIFIIAIGVLGMLLLLLSGSAEGDSAVKKSEGADISEIELQTEKKLTALLKTVSGAGNVRVMVTIESYEERIYAENIKSESSAESDEYSNEYVLIENSGDSGGLTLKVIAPVIRGVGITCEGASSSVVRQEITRLVSSALGISVNKIWVTVMEE